MLSINEVYIGKTPELINIENKLDKFRKKYIDKLAIQKVGVNSDDDLLEINRLFEDFFGFDTFAITVINSIQPDAYTYSLSSRVDIDPKSAVKITKTGYKYDKTAGFCGTVCISSAVIFNSRFSNEEVMAIILHEIGHNFNIVLQSGHGSFTQFYNLIAYIIDLFNMQFISIGARNNSVIKALTDMEKAIRTNNKSFARFIGYYDLIKNMSKDLIMIPFKILNILTLGGASVIIAIYNVLMRLLKGGIMSLAFQVPHYANERQADNFATMYGYGPDISSALQKLRKDASTDIIEKVPLIRHIYSLNMLTVEIAMQPFDCHPRTNVRIRDQFDMLTRELNKSDLDPKLRKSIKADAEACKKQVDKLSDVSKGITDPEFFNHAFWRIAYKNTKDRTIKDIFMSLILGNPDKRFEEYDEAYKLYKERN